jgi:Zn-dependent protease
MTLFVVERIDESRQRKLFTFLDVDYQATAYTWLNLPLMAVIGVVIALIFAPANGLFSQILVGLGYGLLIIISSFCHGLGHIISSRWVNGPVTSMVVTATVNVTHYEDDEEQPSRVHVGRSLGGPLFNLLLGLTAIAIYMVAGQNHFLLFFGIVNLGFGGFTLLPIPSLDGAVILRELRDWKQPNNSTD